MSFPRYPASKDSGVEWLGEVPEHWEILAIKRLASLQSGNGITADSISEHGPYPVYGGNGVRGFSELFTHEGNYPIIGRQGALCGNINYANGKFWASEHAVVVSPIQSAEVGWLGEVLRAMNLNQYSVSAAQPGLSVDTIVNLFIPRPPRDEQISISTFLDHETAKIDALIAEQQRLIELLQEKRQAVISHAVTKGLNPDAPMKDSGVEWLGEVPEHWKILELKHLKKGGTSITYGIVQAGPHIEDGIPYIRTSDMAGDRLMVESCQRTSIAIDEAYARSRVFEGDLVVAIRATVGKVLEVPVELDGANLTQGTAKFSPGSTVSARFVKYSFGADYCQAQIMFSAKGATFLEITLDVLRRLRLAIPPLAEQKEIVNYLEGATGRMGYLLASAQQTIYLLQERRSALISAAVTGQIDVRGLVPEVAAA